MIKINVNENLIFIDITNKKGILSLMLLAVDIGNTNIVAGLFDNNELVKKWRVATDPGKTEDEYALILGGLLKKSVINSAVFSSVVPALDSTFRKLIEKYYGIRPLVVHYALDLGFRIDYARPEEIGADRLVNAAAVSRLYPLPAVIIDFGTATTFCYLDRERRYRGGLILPGIPLMMKALHTGTAKLPTVEIQAVDFLIGRSTVESIQSGVFHQTVGAMNHILDLFHKEYGTGDSVILTGGLARLFAPHIGAHPLLDPDLTLKGLNIVFHLNSPAS